MPDPAHKDMTTQSEELRAILDAQRPTPRWLYRLRRWLRGLLAVTALAFAPITAEAQPLDVERLIPALSIVESNGNPRAVGDKDAFGRPRALGELQIWEVVVQDVNRVHGTRYSHRDAFDPILARDICRRYLAIYCTPKRLGRAPTMEDAARIWNGGPNGHRKTATIKYWHKVAAVL